MAPQRIDGDRRVERVGCCNVHNLRGWPLRCTESAIAHFSSAVQQSEAIRTGALAGQPSLQPALTALEAARLLVRSTSIVRIAPPPENLDLEPWMEQAHDSTPR